MAADPKAILKRYDLLMQQAATHFTFCDDMAPFVAPSRVGIRSKRTPGQSQTHGVYDSTSLMAAELMAQFISSYTMNPSQQWGGMRMRNPAWRDDEEVNEWLDESRDRQLASFRNSLFYAEGPESQVDWVGFGTSCLLADEVPVGTVHAPTRGFRGLW